LETGRALKESGVGASVFGEGGKGTCEFTGKHYGAAGESEDTDDDEGGLERHCHWYWQSQRLLCRQNHRKEFFMSSLFVSRCFVSRKIWEDSGRFI